MDDEDDDEDGSDTEEDALDVSESASVSVKTSKHVKCEEDDDFVNMMDKMMNETLNETKVSVPRSQQVEIVAPVHSRQQKKLYGKRIFLFFCFRCRYTNCAQMNLNFFRENTSSLMKIFRIEKIYC